MSRGGGRDAPPSQVPQHHHGAHEKCPPSLSLPWYLNTGQAKEPWGPSSLFSRQVGIHIQRVPLCWATFLPRAPGPVQTGCLTRGVCGCCARSSAVAGNNDSSYSKLGEKKKNPQQKDDSLTFPFDFSWQIICQHVSAASKLLLFLPPCKSALWTACGLRVVGEKAPF